MAASATEFQYYAPTMTLYALLDAVLGVYLLLLARESRSARWRTVYLLLAADSLIWTGLDAYESMLFFGVVAYEPGGASDLVWFVPYALLLAATVAPTDVRGNEATEELGALRPEPGPVPRGRLIILCLVVRKFTRFDPGKEAIQKLAQIVTYALVINVFFVLVELFTALYSDMPEHLHHFQYLFFGSHGKSALVPWI